MMQWMNSMFLAQYIEMYGSLQEIGLDIGVGCRHSQNIGVRMQM